MRPWPANPTWSDPMPRAILDEARIHPAIRDFVGGLNADIVAEVQTEVARHPVVVVGMGGNPFVRKARRALDAAGIVHEDLDYGNYFGLWRRRNALKMWTGWPTFPMVFVRGMLIGGAAETEKLLASGELRRMLG
jgi:glutaredoxin-related protein